MMDTAKVDIRKLQLLNDRINQCIDALNQVRLSVHGLSHTSPSPQLTGMQGVNPWSQNPVLGPGSTGYALLPQPGAFGFQQAPYVAGLSHTSQAGIPVPIGGVHPLAAFGGAAGESFDISPRPVWADPLLAARIGQTFPYAYVSIPPVVTIY